MTIALTAALILQTSLIVWLLDRKDKRCLQVTALYREEIGALLQRIQAPEQAVYEHATRDLDDDPSGLPLSDEQLAEQEERERVVSFIERFETAS